MDFLGIAALIAAIAFAVLVIFLGKVLNNLSDVLSKTGDTIGKLPDQLDEISKETGTILHNTNETILDLNEKIKTLNPIFGMVEDAGTASRKVSSSLVDLTESMRKQTNAAAEMTDNKDLRGLYGLAAFVYFLNQKKKEYNAATQNT
ncbi:general stress protein [Bacillaceae bacterium JMAK1]|nr:general stress protein [Bacillaceae bacterium JMAK1]